MPFIYRKEVTGRSRKLHDEVLHNLYSSPTNIKVTKSMTMGWMGNVARTWAMQNSYKISAGK